MALQVESVVDGGVKAEEALRRSGRLEALHLALAPTHHLMRILRPIVFSQALLMVAGKSEMPEGSAIGAQLVGRHPPWREALFAEQLAHQLDGRRPVSTTLDQDLEDLALVVDGTPQIHLLARDPDDQASGAGQLQPRDRVTGGGRPPPVPTERGVRISRTTLFGSWFTALQEPAAPGKGGAALVSATVSVL